MKNTSAPFVKLGILVLPQIMLLLTTAMVKAELVADIKNDPDIKQKDNLQQIPIKPTTKQPTEKAQSRCHNDETN
jgi:hypothetical protein